MTDEIRITKQLWLRRQDTPWGIVKIWTLRDYSKACPVQVYFWDIPDWVWRGDEYYDF